MLAKDEERWLSLCELAAKEQDPEKLRRYFEEITRILKAKPPPKKRVPPSGK
jgi:CRISPR/Cas system-associated exonuclease Cas4 (RecB family)